MTEMMTFPCPHCKAEMKAPGDAAGREARCNKCQKSFIVPAQFIFDEPAPAKKPSPSAGAGTGPGAKPGPAPLRSGPGPVFVKPEPKAAQQAASSGQKQALNQVSHVASLLALPLIAVVVLGAIGWWFFGGDDASEEADSSAAITADAAPATTDPAAEAAAVAEVKRLREEQERLQASKSANAQPAAVPAPASANVTPAATTPVVATAPSAIDQAPKGKPGIPDLAKQYGPSVVVVKTNSGSGAGFVAFAADFIVTNYHVVRGSPSVQVVFIEEKTTTTHSVTVVAVDADNDLALLRLSQPSKAQVLEFAADTALSAGTEIFTIGSPAIGTAIPTQAISNGVISNAERLIGNQKYLQTNTTITPANSGGPLFDHAGKVVGVVSAVVSSVSKKAIQQEDVGFALPSSLVKVLYREREKKFRVDGDFIAWEAKQPFERLKRHAGAIELNTYPTDLLMDAERDQLIGISAETNKVIFIDLKARKVAREVFPSGTDPVDLRFGAPGEVWVANRTSKNLVSLDLVSGKIMKNIALEHEPHALAIGRKWLWFMDGTGQALVIKMTGKEESETALNIRSMSMYGAGANILCGSTTAWLCEFEPDKVETAVAHRRSLKKALDDLNAGVKSGTPQANEAKRKSITKDMTSNDATLSKAIKMYTKPKGLDADFSANQQSLFVDEPRKRIYYGRCVMALNEPGKIIGVFKSPEHSLKNNQTLSEFWSKNQALDHIRAVSPDGTVAVSGTHIYNAMEFTVIAELPVPTTAVVFHSDNKTLYFADPANKQVVGIDYRPKADE